MGRVRILVPEIGWYSVLGLKGALSDLEPLQSHVNETTFVPKKGDLVINYGVIKWPIGWENRFGSSGARIINSPDRVRVSTNRRESLPTMKEAGVRVPDWTQHYDKAILWQSEGHSILCRQKKRSYGGAGLSFCEPTSELPKDSALYVKYRPKKVEYRVHVFGGKVIELQEKRRRLDFQGQINYNIRSYDNGWVLCKKNVIMPPDCINQSLKAVQALGLDFGATDVGWDEDKKEATVYEVNTAPGLTGSAFSKYSEAIRSYVSCI